MNFTDLTIIYLACGAPVGVYFYIQPRKSSTIMQNSAILWGKCLLITLFWLPFAFVLLQHVVTKKLRKGEFVENNQKDSLFIAKIDNFEKSFSQILLETESIVLLFDFRETFQRYVGLTLANSSGIGESRIDSNDLFQIVNQENSKLATICLNRRNRLRLEHHQTLARKDFVQMLGRINSCFADKEKLSFLAFEFARLIDDVEFTAKLKQIFENSTQTENNFTVKKMENEVWNPTEHKPQPTKKTALSLPAISVRTMMSKQD